MIWSIVLLAMTKALSADKNEVHETIITFVQFLQLEIQMNREIKKYEWLLDKCNDIIL